MRTLGQAAARFKFTEHRPLLRAMEKFERSMSDCSGFVTMAMKQMKQATLPPQQTFGVLVGTSMTLVKHCTFQDIDSGRRLPRIHLTDGGVIEGLIFTGTSWGDLIVSRPGRGRGHWMVLSQDVIMSCDDLMNLRLPTPYDQDELLTRLVGLLAYRASDDEVPI